MDLNREEAQTVIKLFQAHFTISEIVERTGVKIESVVTVLNAPRTTAKRDFEESVKMVAHGVA